MPIRPWKPDSVRRLEIGGASGPRLVMIVGLSAVILLSAATTAWVFFRGGDKSDGSPERGKTHFARGVPFKCSACGHEFVMTDADFQNYQRDIDRSAGPLSRLPHCPECGARHAAVMMQKCPKCGKNYVPYGVEAGIKMAQGQPPPEGAKHICPHCKTDVNEYRRQHRRR